MRFLRLSTAGLSIALLASCQSMQSPGTSVIGTGDPARDPAAVQAAVDGGGTVRLRGTFDFGERGRVNITRDVEIVGIDGATIRGGVFSFYSRVPEVLPASAPGPRIAIRNLRFTGALWAPINIGYASGLVITGNRIADVQPHPLPMPGFEDGQTQAGVLFGMAWAQGSITARRYAPGVFTGKVVIEDNVIDVQSSAPGRTLGYGIFGQWTTGIDATIARNRVTGASRTSIEAIDNYRGSEGQGRIRITANQMTTAEQGIPFPGPQTPNAVLAGYFMDRAAALDPARSMDIEISGNVIETRGPSSHGVFVFANGARVKGNTITSSGIGAVAVAVVGADSEVNGNILRGSGMTGIVVASFDVLVGSHNRMSANDLRDFKASGAQLFFSKGTFENVCTGQESIVRVMDEGARNRCP